MNKVYINYDKYTYTIREPSPDDNWDRGDTDSTCQMLGLSLSPRELYHEELSVDFPIEQGKTYYLVWASYSTGDSFGNDDGQVEIVDLFTSFDKAHAVEKLLLAHNRGEREFELLEDRAKPYNEWAVTLVRENGQHYTFSVPWHGYFESLENIYITEVQLLD